MTHVATTDDGDLIISTTSLQAPLPPDHNQQKFDVNFNLVFTMFQDKHAEWSVDFGGGPPTRARLIQWLRAAADKLETIQDPERSVPVFFNP